MVVGVLSQRLEKIVPSTFIGSGKGRRNRPPQRRVSSPNVVLIDAKLSGAQQRNLQELVGCKVIDRQQLILDIFAQRAQTREGKLQVELAQLKDQLPDVLLGKPSRAFQGLPEELGRAGPGETKLESDRRRIKTRMEQVTKELEAVRQTREPSIEKGAGKPVTFRWSLLAGYTNAGKSTLLNKFTKSDAYVEDKLFATLDPTTRKLRLPSGKQIVATDTVGFYQ